GAYQRVRVSGQIVFSRKDEYFMMQGSRGLRFISKKPASLENGDTVEVVGFPDWSSAFPVLREAVARKTGHAVLPQAAKIPPADLIQARHDGTLGGLEGTLTGSRMTLGGPVLELQSGARNFVARLDATNVPELSLPLGSKLELTGVYVAQGGNRSAGQ